MSSTTAGRPTTVTISYIIWLVTVLIGIISGIVGFFSSNSHVSGAAETTGVVVGAIIAIVIALVELFIVFRMRDGRRWARIVLLILAILQVIGVVAAFNILGTIGLIAVIVATVLMFLPSSNAYFRR
jgi:hypothetical protein